MALLTSGRSRRSAPAALILACFLTAVPGSARAHVGMRLRLGYRPLPELITLARLTEIYVEAASGYTIDLREYREEAALREAFRNDEVDAAIEYPAEAWALASCAAADAPADASELLKAYFREKYGAVWIGAYDLRDDLPPCREPSCVITRGISGDLAFYTLPDYLRKLAGSVAPRDMEDVLRRNPRGGDRSLLRELLAGKKLI